MTTMFTLTFIGMATKTGQKSGNEYQIAKFIDEGTEDVFEFFVPEKVKENLKTIKKFKPYNVGLAITSRQGDIRVDLDSVSAIGG